jgi:hypothetical protein
MGLSGGGPRERASIETIRYKCPVNYTRTPVKRGTPKRAAKLSLLLREGTADG